MGARQWRRELPLELLLDAIAEALGVELDELRRQRWNHTQRDTAMYLCRELGERTLKEIGRAFGVKAAAAGHAIGRAKRLRQSDRRIANAIAEQRTNELLEH